MVMVSPLTNKTLYRQKPGLISTVQALIYIPTSNVLTESPQVSAIVCSLEDSYSVVIRWYYIAFIDAFEGN